MRDAFENSEIQNEKELFIDLDVMKEELVEDALAEGEGKCRFYPAFSKDEVQNGHLRVEIMVPVEALRRKRS